MAISTYGELKTALADHLHRGDLTSVLPDFILMGESKLNRLLQLRDMVQSQTGNLSTSVRTLALPTLFQEKIQFRITDPLRELTYVPPGRLMEYSDEENATGEPRRFTITSQIELDRIPDSAYAYVLTYYKGYRLSGDSDTNYLLTNYPQAYLYAAQVHAANYMGNFQRAQLMSAQLASEIAEIKRAEAKRANKDGATLITELNARRTYSIDHD